MGYLTTTYNSRQRDSTALASKGACIRVPKHTNTQVQAEETRSLGTRLRAKLSLGLHYLKLIFKIHIVLKIHIIKK